MNNKNKQKENYKNEWDNWVNSIELNDGEIPLPFEVIKNETLCNLITSKFNFRIMIYQHIV